MAPPDRSPFQTKLCLTLELAKAIAQAAREEAERNEWRVVVSILDEGANLLYLERMDGAQIGSVQVSQEKGATAIKFKRPSKAFEDAILTGGKLNFVSLPHCVPLEGGLPLIVNGQLVGGIGISGVTSAQDGQCAQAGADALAKIAKLHLGV